MTGHFLEIGFLSWIPHDTFCVYLIIETLNVPFMCLSSIVSLLDIEDTVGSH